MQQMSVTIRPLADSDAAFLAYLYSRPEILSALHGGFISEPEWKQAISEWATDADEENYIVLADGKRAAWIKLNALVCGAAGEPAMPFLSMLVVDPALARRGLGTAALGFCRETLAGRGYRGMRIHTTQDNAAAIALYTGFGCTITERPRLTGQDGVERPYLTLEMKF